jgi:predicted transcriptional regulator
MSSVEERLQHIEQRLSVLEKIIINKDKTPTITTSSISMDDLLSLTDSLQKSMLAIQELEDATTTEIAEKTGRSRSVETIYMNQLARLGYVRKERRGRKIFFSVLKFY